MWIAGCAALGRHNPQSTSEWTSRSRREKSGLLVTHASVKGNAILCALGVTKDRHLSVEDAKLQLRPSFTDFGP
ncbi:MAG TPA: hypothetical protein VFN02_10265 [Ktedonobacteraceae bacterium]|nr:hypothetical protein [Ktedonobacteraceae bacterium]